MSDIPKNIIGSAEFKAIKEIENITETEDIETMGQIVSRIHDINKAMKGFDLVIESQTFRELANITGVSIPRLNDRIVSAIKVLLKAASITHENSYNTIVNILQTLFEWDGKNLIQIDMILADLKVYTTIFEEEEIIEFTQDMIDKYKFNSRLYNQFINEEIADEIEQKSKIKNKFLHTIPFISKIGPAISMYESIKNEKDQSKAFLDATLGLLVFCMQQINLPEIYISDLIPNLIRSIARQAGINEDQALSMRTHQLLDISSKDQAGEIIIEISKYIAHQDKQSMTHSRIGKFFWTILADLNFWENASYLPQLGMLKNIARGGQPQLAQEKQRAKLTNHSGKIANILQDNTNAT
jgi:hypothetical protein